MLYATCSRFGTDAGQLGGKRPNKMSHKKHILEGKHQIQLSCAFHSFICATGVVLAGDHLVWFLRVSFSVTCSLRSGFDDELDYAMSTV